MLSTIQISESQVFSDQNHGDPAGMAGFSGNDGLTADAVRRKTVGTDSGFGTGGGRLYPYGIGRAGHGMNSPDGIFYIGTDLVHAHCHDDVLRPEDQTGHHGFPAAV